MPERARCPCETSLARDLLGLCDVCVCVRERVCVCVLDMICKHGYAGMAKPLTLSCTECTCCSQTTCH